MSEIIEKFHLRQSGCYFVVIIFIFINIFPFFQLGTCKAFISNPNFKEIFQTVHLFALAAPFHYYYTVSIRRRDKFKGNKPMQWQQEAEEAKWRKLKLIKQCRSDHFAINLRGEFIQVKGSEENTVFKTSLVS